MATLSFLLPAVAVLTAAQAASSPSATRESTSDRPALRELAKRHGFNIGSAVPASCLRTDADDGRYATTATSVFNLVELENDSKPPAIWAGPHEYRFENMDFVLGEPGKKGWAQEHKMKFRGHVLVYARDEGFTLPDWLRRSESSLSKENAAELLHDYIRAVAGRYRGKVAMWDVVNEAIDDAPTSNPFNLRDSFWLRKLGPEFLVLAFKWAKEADPKAELYYNEYGIEAGGPKGRHVLDLAKWLREQGAPIDGIGMQYHVDCHTRVVRGDSRYQYVEEIGKLGLAFMITELDVAVPVESFQADDPRRGLVPKDEHDLQAQAKVYAAVFAMALSSKHCHGVNIWGLTDGHSWIPWASQWHAGAATLFDADYKPKPAYDAVAEVLGR
jgi:endo-1,4-beta-xylanase